MRGQHPHRVQPDPSQSPGGKLMRECRASLQQARHFERVAEPVHLQAPCRSPSSPWALSSHTNSGLSNGPVLESWCESFRLASSPSNKMSDKDSQSKVTLLREGAAYRSNLWTQSGCLPHLEVAEVKKEFAACPRTFTGTFSFSQAF